MYSSGSTRRTLSVRSLLYDLHCRNHDFILLVILNAFLAMLNARNMIAGSASDRARTSNEALKMAHFPNVIAIGNVSAEGNCSRTFSNLASSDDVLAVSDEGDAKVPVQSANQSLDTTNVLFCLL